MPKHEFIVTVHDCTAAQAETVMIERVDIDDYYGFHYTIDWAPIKREEATPHVSE